MNFLDQLIEHREETQILRKEFKSKGYTGAGLTNNCFARHDRFLKEFAPRMTEFFDPSDHDVVEIGCGTGSVTHAFADIFCSVNAFEISEVSIQICRKRAEIFQLENVDFYHCDPDSLVDAALSKGGENTIYILYAVLEHMTEEERLNTLSKIWAKMGSKNFLYVGNTPNRLSYQDLHTHQQPFLLSLPDITALHYLKAHPEFTLSKYLTECYENCGIEEFSLARKRKGLGVSYHDFEIAMSGTDLNESVVLPDIHMPWQFYDAVLASFHE